MIPTPLLTKLTINLKKYFITKCVVVVLYKYSKRRSK